MKANSLKKIAGIFAVSVIGGLFTNTALSQEASDPVMSVSAFTLDASTSYNQEQGTSFLEDAREIASHVGLLEEYDACIEQTVQNGSDNIFMDFFAQRYESGARVVMAECGEQTTFRGDFQAHANEPPLSGEIQIETRDIVRVTDKSVAGVSATMQTKL